MSDDGSDDNDCHSTSAPCSNLQTVLDRAANGADIYVTSNTLSLNFRIDNILTAIGRLKCCIINSSLSYTLRSYHNSTINLTCSGMFYYFYGFILCWLTTLIGISYYNKIKIISHWSLTFIKAKPVCNFKLKNNNLFCDLKHDFRQYDGLVPLFVMVGILCSC